MDMGIGASLLQITWINVVLSGDNAMVIALACRTLVGRDRWFGIVLGAGAAVVLRTAFTVGLSEVMLLPFARIVASLLLLFIAVKLLTDPPSEDASVEDHSSLWRAMGAIIVADIVMSLDNVVAIAAAAHGSVPLIVAGLAISVPIVVFGSTLIVAIIKRLPAIIWIGSAFLGWIAGETFFSDPAVWQQMPHDIHAWLFASSGATIVLVVGWISWLQRKSRPIQRD